MSKVCIVETCDKCGHCTSKPAQGSNRVMYGCGGTTTLRYIMAGEKDSVIPIPGWCPLEEPKEQSIFLIGTV